jgi:outer membrane receptor protein involved in Fe transport
MFMSYLRLRSLALLAGTLAAATVAVAADAPEEIVIIGITPAEGAGLAPERIPGNVQHATADDLQRSQSLDLTDYLARHLGSVSFNSAQGNPLQPDVNLRGFTASPLLGLPQGIAVYQDGARINEPLGDAVNWDLVPRVAIQSIDVISGTSPLFGLNTLGGALTLDMKNGFSAPGHALELSGGAWGRFIGSAQSGGNDGTFGYYAALQYFREDGWRELSNSDALGIYGALSWHNEVTTLDLGLHVVDSDLRGNGASPIGQLAKHRDAIFTAPDITRNELLMLTLEGTQRLGPELTLAGSAFWRDNDTVSFNGDASEFATCQFANGLRLLEGFDEDGIDALGLDEDDLCDGATHADAEALENYLNLLAGGNAFDLDDLTGDLSGSGVLADDAINNHSRRDQRSRGTDWQLISTRPVAGRDNYFVVGAALFEGRSRFASRVELAGLDADTRSTDGLGTGAFVDSLATEVATRTRSQSLFFSETLSLTEAIGVTLAGRWNSTRLRLRDQSGDRPELDGDHRYQRFNPSFGITWQVLPNMNLYGSYAESSRAPTPIELSCNEDTFARAMAFAVARGEDPGDVDFECRLPNAFLADPPLAQVVAHGFEGGARGRLGGTTQYHLGAFRISNHNDIIFQTTGRATGLFANVARTRRSGFELSARGLLGPIDWFGALSYVDARFAAPFRAASPNHPLADAAGEIAVERGDRIPGIPKMHIKLGADWALNEVFSFGAEVQGFSARRLRGDETNALDPIPGYAALNLNLRYRLRRQVELFGRVDNLLGERYETFGIVGEDPTEVLGDVDDATPYFLSPGAPRAAWVGIRITW